MNLGLIVNIILFTLLTSLLTSMGYGVNTGEYWSVLVIVVCIGANTIMGVLEKTKQN